MAALLCPGGMGFGRKGNKLGGSREEYLAMPLEARLLQHGRLGNEGSIQAGISSLPVRERPTETLIRLQVVEDFFPSSALEIPVKRGEFVRALCYEGSWLFVQTQNGANGYIPRRHCKITELKGILASNGLQESPVNSTEISSDVGYFSDSIPRSIPKYFREPSVSSCGLHSSDSDCPCSSSSGSPANTPEARRLNGTHRPHTPEPLTRQNEDSSFPTGSGLSKRFARPSELADEIITRSVTTNIPVCGRRCASNCMHQQNFRRRAQTDAGQKHSHSSLKNPTHRSKVQNEMEAVGKSRDHRDPTLPQAASSPIIIDTIADLQAHKHLQRQVSRKIQDKGESLTTIPTSGSNKARGTLPGCNHPQLIVIEEYEKQAKTDITVHRGDFASILDDNNPIWMYVQTEDGRRGYVPKEVIINHK